MFKKLLEKLLNEQDSFSKTIELDDFQFDGKSYYLVVKVNYEWADTSFSHLFGTEKQGHYEVKDFDIVSVAREDGTELDPTEFVEGLKESGKWERFEAKLVDELEDYAY